MGFFARIRFFQKMVIGVCLLFFGLMVVVTVVAFGRKSGSTGLDMTQIQKLRYEKRVSDVADN